MQIANSKSHKGDFGKQKATNCYLAEASVSNRTLEGECDALRLYLKRETSIANHIRAISKKEKQQTVTSPKPASPI
jgi:hypothetical protein